MNATTNFTVKSLRANKVRTLVTIAGVALAAALLTAVLTTYVSLNDYLYRSEAHLAGTWMACVEADGSSALDEKIADAQADPQVAGTAIMRDVGFAKLTADQQNTQGTYLAIRSIEGDVGDICGIAPSEGRLPENDHEIMLFSTWNDYGGVNLGDTVTFDVGQRVARLAPGEEGSMSAGTMTASWGVQGEAHESEITDGTPLNSSMGVLEADIDGGIFNEDITNTEESTYTVVGFYDRPGYALSTAAGMVGVTAGGAAPDAFTDVFFTLNDVANTQQVEEAAEALFPDEHVVLHTAMLRYMGVSSDSSIWATFYGLVVVLAAVIAELFHNKFGNFVKSSLFVPVIASAILVGTLWFTLLSPRGVVNSIIHAFGLPSVNWLGGKLTSMLSVCIVSVWKNVGYFLVIYFAGIMDIPRSLYEAAEVDGANAFQRFFKITLPGLSSVTFLVVTLGTIWSFQVFDLVYTMTGGGPGTSTVTLVLTTYNAAFKEYNMGYASAVAMLMFVFVLAVSGLQKLLLKGGED